MRVGEVFVKYYIMMFLGGGQGSRFTAGGFPTAQLCNCVFRIWLLSVCKGVLRVLSDLLLFVCVCHLVGLQGLGVSYGGQGSR